MFQKYIFRCIAFFSIGLFGSSFFLQYFASVIPCPLCIVQRYTYLLIGILALCLEYRFFSSVRTYFYRGGIFFLALFGELIAMRQVWMQYHPLNSDPTKCFTFFGSFFHSVLLSLGGVGDCAKRDWTILSFSLAEWSVLFFGCILIATVAYEFIIRRSSQGN